jgi:hypothetical protein
VPSPLVAVTIQSDPSFTRSTRYVVVMPSSYHRHGEGGRPYLWKYSKDVLPRTQKPLNAVAQSLRYSRSYQQRSLMRGTVPLGINLAPDCDSGD